MTLKEIPCVKDQAYFILIGVNGSWIYEILHKQLEDKEFCKQVVEYFVADYGWNSPPVQNHIDDSYEDIMEYRRKKNGITLIGGK